MAGVRHRSKWAAVGAVIAAWLAVAPAAHGARVDPGDIIVADTNVMAPAILAVDPETGERTVISSNTNPVDTPTLSHPQGLAVEEDGSILVGDPAGGSPNSGIIRIDPDTGMRSYVSTNAGPAEGPSFFTPYFLAVEGDGDILVSDQDAFAGFNGGIIRVDPDTGARTTVSANGNPSGGPNFQHPNGIAVEADGDIVVADPILHQVVRVNPATGARTLISANDTPPGEPELISTVGLALEGDGNILVASNSNIPEKPDAVLRVDPTSGVRSPVSTSFQPAGAPLFGIPLAITTRSDGGIVVSDLSVNGDDAILAVDPVTGVRRLVSSNTSPATPPLVDSLSVDIEVYRDPPQTTITDAPSGTTTERRPTISFVATPSAASFECRYGDAQFATCTSPFTPAEDLPLGPATFAVRAIGDFDNPDQTPATASFDVVEAPPPDTEVSGAVVNAKKTQRQGGKKIKVKIEGGAQEAVTGVATGQISKAMKLTTVRHSTGAGKRAGYRLGLEGKKKDEKALELLRDGKKLRAKLSLTLTDASGNSVTEKRVVRLKRA